MSRITVALAVLRGRPVISGVVFRTPISLDEKAWTKGGVITGCTISH